jgi:hypothetical protein
MTLLGAVIAARCENRRRTMAVSSRERTAVHEAAHTVAALVFGIPVLSVSLDPPNMHRGRFTAEHACGLECLTVLCLAGIAAEEYFFGTPIPDPAAIQQDLNMAKECVARAISDPLRAQVELARCRLESQRLVNSAQQRIRVIANALLVRGVLSSEEIFELASTV